MMGMFRSGAEAKGWTCADLDKSAAIMVQELPQFDAKRLNGFQVWIMDRNIKKDPWGREVLGYTVCGTKTMVIWDNDNHQTSALPHEIGHALQNCYAKLPLDPEWKGEWFAADHSDWFREGIFLAVTKAETE